MPSNSLDNTQSTLYTEHGLDNNYVLHSGKFSLPIAQLEPPGVSKTNPWSPVAVVQAHAPYRTRQVRFNTTKDGAPPVVPSPQDSGASVFLNGVIHFDYPKINATVQTYSWTVSGDYTFVENVRANANDGFILGDYPFFNVITSSQSGGSPPQNYTGAVSYASTDVFIGYNAGQQITSLNTYYAYSVPTYYPGIFLSSSMLIGGNSGQ